MTYVKNLKIIYHSNDLCEEFKNYLSHTFQIKPRNQPRVSLKWDWLT
jgi:hypothetical protein